MRSLHETKARTQGRHIQDPPRWAPALPLRSSAKSNQICKKLADASVDAISTRDGNEERVGALLRASDTIGALARAAAALKGLSQDPL